MALFAISCRSVLSGTSRAAELDYTTERSHPGAFEHYRESELGERFLLGEFRLVISGKSWVAQLDYATEPSQPRLVPTLRALIHNRIRRLLVEEMTLVNVKAHGHNIPRRVQSTCGHDGNEFCVIELLVHLHRGAE